MSGKTKHRLRSGGLLLLVLGLVTLILLTKYVGSFSSRRADDVEMAVAFGTTFVGLALVAISPPVGTRSRYGIAGFAWRTIACVAIASALNLLYWVIVIEPHTQYDERYRPGLVQAVSLIDLPVAIFGVIAPRPVRDYAVDVYMQSFEYGHTRFCFGIPPGNLWRHLAIAVAVWVAFLMVPVLLRLAALRSASPG